MQLVTEDSTINNNTQAKIATNHWEFSVNIVVGCANVAAKGSKLTLIQVKIGEIPVNALLDTGVSHALMRKSFFQKIKKKYPFVNLDV